MPVKALSGLQRGLDVLEHVATNQPVAAGEIVTSLRLDRSALQRVLVTLDEGGWIRSGERGWELGPRALVLLTSAGSYAGLVARAREVLRRLRDDTGETAFLAVATADGMGVADVAESAQLVRIAPRPGLVIDAELSAAFLAVAAFLPAADAARLIERAPGRVSVERELEATRERGWSLHAGQVHTGVTSIAAPVYDASRRPIAALVVTGPAARLPRLRLGAVAELVCRAADDVSMTASG